MLQSVHLAGPLVAMLQSVLHDCGAYFRSHGTTESQSMLRLHLSRKARCASSTRFRAIGADAAAARLRPLSALLGLEDRGRPQRMLGERDWGECQRQQRQRQRHRRRAGDVCMYAFMLLNMLHLSTLLSEFTYPLACVVRLLKNGQVRGVERPVQSPAVAR